MIKSLVYENMPTWLSTNKLSENTKKKYRHRILKEDIANRPLALEELKKIVNIAHDDARLRLRNAFDNTLDPLLGEGESSYDPAEGYPHIFDMKTLKGYFGEIFSGLIVENYAPFGDERWKVPVFSFRYHEIAFDQLEMMMQTGEKINTIPGRTGDDCLAFVLEDDQIIKILFCEAKCTAASHESMISSAHEKISGTNIIPVEIRRMIELLRDYDGDEVLKWRKALWKLRVKDEIQENQRFDLVSYVCGKSPVRPVTRTSWIPSQEPHKSYSVNRSLEAVEVHLNDVEGIIREVYGKEEEE